MYKTLAAMVACLALTSKANAVPINYSFSGTVDSVYHHPPGELWDGRVLPLGTSVSGNYTFEVNPNNPEQAINGFFEFTVGALHVELPLVIIQVMLNGDRNWHQGDRYIAFSQNFYPYEFGGYVEEGFGIILDAAAGGILTDHSITPLLNFTEFDVRHEFYYFYRTRYGGVEIRAPLESLVAGVPEPSSIALLLSGALLFFVFGLCSKSGMPPYFPGSLYKPKSEVMETGKGLKTAGNAFVFRPCGRDSWTRTCPGGVRLMPGVSLKKCTLRPMILSTYWGGFLTGHRVQSCERLSVFSLASQVR